MKNNGKSSKPILAAHSTQDNENPTAPPSQGKSSKARGSRAPKVQPDTMKSLVLERISDGILAFDAQMNHVYVNERAGELLGRQPDQLLGRNFWEEYPESRSAPFADACQRAFSTQTVVPFDGYFPSSKTWFEGRIYPSSDGLSVLISDRGLPEQEEMMAALERSEQIFSKAFHASPDAIIISRLADGLILEVNEGWQKLFGYPPEYALGRRSTDLNVIVDHARVRQQTIEQLQSDGAVRDLELEVRRKSGEIRVVSMFIENIDLDGVPCLLTIIRDITERKQVQESLQALIHQTTTGITRTNLQGRFMFVNQAFCDMIGYSAEELIGKTIWEVSHPGEVAKNQRMFERLVTEGEPYQLEKRLVRRNGSTLWANVGTSPLRDAQGQPYAAVSVIVDITRRKRAEEALLDSARRTLYLSTLSDTLRPLARPSQIEIEAARLLGTHLKASRVFYAEIQPDGSAVLRNQYVTGMPDLPATFELRSAIPEPMFARFLAGREFVTAGRDIRLQDSDPVLTEQELPSVHAQIVVPLLRDGQLVAALFVQQSEVREWKSEEVNLVQETAERMQSAIERADTDRSLRESEERFRILANTVPSMVWSTAPDGTVKYLNQRWHHYTGLTTEDSVENWAVLTIHPDDYERCIRAWKHSLTTGEEYQLDLRYRRYDGEYRWFQSRAVPSRDENGNITAWHGVSTDVHERVQAQQELQQVINQTPFMLTRCSRDLRYRFVSRTYAEMVHRTPDELTGRPIVEIMGEAGFKAIEPHIEQVLLGKRVEYEAEVPFEGVGVQSLHVVNIPDTNERGEVIGWFASITDITERKRAEEYIRFQAYILENVHDAVIATDDKSILTAWNRAAEELYGWTAAEVLGRRASDVIRSNVTPEQRADLIGRVNAGEHLVFEAVHHHKDGHPFQVEVRAMPLHGDDGKVIGRSTSISDITERKRMDDALRQSQAQLTEELADSKRLQAISSQLIQENNIDSLYNQIVEAAIFLMRANIGSMQVLDPASNELHLLAWKGFHPQAASFWKTVTIESGGTCAQALRLGKRVIVEDTEASELISAEDRECYRLSGINAVQTTPLIARDGRLVGMISTHWSEAHKPLERELQLLDVLARQAADLIERKWAEERVRESEERFRALVSQTTAGISQTDAESRLIFVNPRFAEMLGYSEGELLGRTIWELTYTDDLQENLRLYKNMLEQGTSYHFEKRFIRKDGSLLWTSVSVTSIYDAAGRSIGGVGVIIDIEQRKKVEGMLVREQELLERIFESIPVMISMYDPATGLRLNSHLKQLTGWGTAGSITPRELVEACYPDPVYRTEVTQRIAASAPNEWVDIRMQTRGGGVLDTSWSNITFPDGTQVGIGLDMTERKRAEEALRDSEQKFSRIFHSAPYAIVLNDTTNAKFVDVNDAFVDMIGYSREELLGKTTEELGIFANPQNQIEVLQQYEAQKLLRSFEFQLRKKSGDWIWVSINGNTVEIADRKYILSLIIDITEQKNAEEELRTSEEKYRHIVETANEGIWEIDKDTRTLFVNRRMAEMLGYSPEEMIGRSAFEFVLPEDNLDGENRLERARTGIPARSSEFRYRRKDGSILWTLASNKPQFDENGNFAGAVAMLTDISERKQYERSLIEYARQQAALYGLADQLHRIPSLEEGYSASLEAIRKALLCERASILLFDSSHVMRFVAWHGLSEEYRKATDGHSPWKYGETQPAPIYYNDVRTADLTDALKATILGEGIGALAFVPIMFHGRLIGKFMVYFNAPHTFRETELDMCLTISRQLASAIDRKRAEQALRESQQRLSLTYNHTAIGIVESAPDGRIIQCNEEYGRILGYPPAEVAGRFLADITYAEDAATEMKLYRQLMNGEIPVYHMEKRFVKKDGSLVWCEVVRSVVLDEGGEPLYSIGAVFDISDRRKREEALRARTEEIETLMEVSPIGVFVAHDPECRHITGNPAGYKLVEMPEEAQGNISKSAPEPERPAYRVFRDGVELSVQDLPMQAAARLGKEVHEPDLEIRFANGVQKYIYAYARPLFDTQGKTRGAIATMLDITERKRNEEALRLDATIMENVPAGVYLIRASDGTIVHSNPTFDRLFGYEPGEIIGKHVSVINAPTEAEESGERVAERIISTLQRDGSWQGEVYSKRKDGTPFWCFASVITFQHASYGTVWVAARQDITERKRAESRLALLAEISDLTRKFDDPIELMSSVAQMVGKHLQVKRCLFNEIDVEHDLEIVHRDYHEGTHSVAGIHKITDYSGVTSTEMVQGRTVVNNDSKVDPRTASDYERSYVPNGERAYVTVPLMRNERWVASLWVSDDKPRKWTTEEIALLETIAERTWTATEKLRIHGALRDSEERLRVTFNTTAVGFATLMPDTRFAEVNQAFCDLVGYSRQELLTMTCNALTHPDYLESTKEHVAQLLAGKIPSFVLEKIYIRRDGTEIWVQDSVSLVRESNGEPLHLIAINQDITERKRAEDALHQLNTQLESRVQSRTAELQAAYEFLRQSEATSRLILESMPNAILVTDRDGRIVYANSQVEQLFGYAPQEVIGQPVEILIPERYHGSHRGYRTEASHRRERRFMGLDLDIFGKRKDAREFPVDVMLSPISNNTTWDVMITIRDNTQQKQAQEALRANEEKLRRLFEILPVGISFLDNEGRISEMNSALTRILGLSKKELIEGKFKPRRYIRANGNPMPPSEFASARARNEQKPIYNVETGIIKEDGDVIWTSVSATPVDVADVDVVIATIDITERKKAEEALEKSRERLRLLSRRLVEVQEEERRALADELHDRVGQNLAALNLNLNILRSQLSAEALQIIGTRLDDSVALVNEILTITRNVMADLRSNVLDDYGLESALREYTDKFTQRTGIQVITEKPAAPLPRLDPNIEMTLLRIAQEALTNVSRHAQADQVNISVGMENNEIFMSIVDNGTGILSWQKANQPGSHGLRIIRERAEAFSGSLQVHSAYKKGTTIQVKIPLDNTGTQTTRREKRS